MNEVDESVRVLNNQIQHYRKNIRNITRALDNFMRNCKHSLEEEDIDLVYDMLNKALAYYGDKLEEACEVRREILEKYNYEVGK